MQLRQLETAARIAAARSSQVPVRVSTSRAAPASHLCLPCALTAQHLQLNSRQFNEVFERKRKFLSHVCERRQFVCESSQGESSRVELHLSACSIGAMHATRHKVYRWIYVYRNIYKCFIRAILTVFVALLAWPPSCCRAERRSSISSRIPGASFSSTL